MHERRRRAGHDRWHATARLEPIEGVDDDHVALARVPDDLAQPGPVGRRPGLLVDIDPLARDPDPGERVDLSIEILLDG